VEGRVLIVPAAAATRKTSKRNGSSGVRHLPPVHQAQPAAEPARRLVGRAAVKRHQRARAARHPGDLRPPLVRPNRRHFDEVLAAVDDFFEAMHVHHVVSVRERVYVEVGSGCILTRGAGGASERTIEGASTARDGGSSPRRGPLNFFLLSGCAQGFHQSSTVFPQTEFDGREPARTDFCYADMFHDE